VEELSPLPLKKAKPTAMLAHSKKEVFTQTKCKAVQKKIISKAQTYHHY